MLYNRGIEFMNLLSIVNDATVQKYIPPYFDHTGRTTCYFIHIQKTVEIYFELKVGNIRRQCRKLYSFNLELWYDHYDHYGHVITEDLKIA